MTKQSPKKTKAPPQPEALELVGLLKGIRSEWGKITWPTLPQIWGNTVIVVVMVILVSIGMWGVDNAFKGIIWFLTKELPKHLM